MSYAPICRNCERLSGTAVVVDRTAGRPPADCAVCGGETFRYVEVGALAPDPKVLARAFNVYLDRLQTAHGVAAQGLADMAARARGQRSKKPDPTTWFPLSRPASEGI